MGTVASSTEGIVDLQESSHMFIGHPSSVDSQLPGIKKVLRQVKSLPKLVKTFANDDAHKKKLLVHFPPSPPWK